VDDVTMPDSSISGQLGQLLISQGAMAVDIGVIKSQMIVVTDHETRIRQLEALRSKLGAIWAAGVVVGGATGWLAAFLSGRR
jgi:hypothetical protein